MAKSKRRSKSKNDSNSLPTTSTQKDMVVVDEGSLTTEDSILQKNSSEKPLRKKTKTVSNCKEVEKIPDNSIKEVKESAPLLKVSDPELPFTKSSEADIVLNNTTTEPNKQDTVVKKQVGTFKELGLNAWLLEALQRMSLTVPTEIQANCIPAILEGRDVVGGAKTGSGKTAAFALPMLHKLAVDPYGVFGLVLTPTRELALQLAEQFAAFGESISLKYAVVVGGLNMMKQTVELSHRPHIIIATPGRLADLIRSSPDVIHLSRLSTLVLDEADMLLTPTFAEALADIFAVLPQDRQTLLFTATMTENVTALLNKKRVNRPEPFTYICQSSVMTVSTLKQEYIFLPSYVREAYLCHVLALPENENKSTIIFTGRCRTAEMVKIMLCHLDHSCVALHSLMSQRARIDAIGRFKTGHTTTLISTDVGSRGLDIPSVQLVINYDLPQDTSSYIHRVGRTARAGKGGSALSFVTERDIDLVHAIEERVGKPMEEFQVSENKILEILNKVTEAKKKATMIMHDCNFGEQRRARQERNMLISASISNHKSSKTKNHKK